MHKLTKNQLDRLQHATGFNRYGEAKFTEGKRNHFCGEDAACRELVALGYMRSDSRFPSEVSGGAPVFYVTEEGRAAMVAQTPKPKPLSRSAQRYRQWLTEGYAEFDMPFGEFLRQRLYADSPRPARATRRKDEDDGIPF